LSKTRFFYVKTWLTSKHLLNLNVRIFYLYFLNSLIFDKILHCWMANSSHLTYALSHTFIIFVMGILKIYSLIFQELLLVTFTMLFNTSLVLIPPV
jgi:hypothetical protein